MQQTVRDWMKDLVVYVDPETSVTDALALMRHRYVNSLIVRRTATNPEFGIITSIDICDKIVARDANPSKTRVIDVMNSPLITVDQDMDLKECARMMKEHRIHHLPVCDKNGHIIGMISAENFLVVAEVMGRGTGDRVLS
jgi:CBS domain-containing protein